jgi:hypothetical protein
MRSRMGWQSSARSLNEGSPIQYDPDRLATRENVAWRVQPRYSEVMPPSDEPPSAVCSRPGRVRKLASTNGLTVPARNAPYSSNRGVLVAPVSGSITTGQ